MRANRGSATWSADDVKLAVKLVDPFTNSGNPNAERNLRLITGKNMEDSDSIVFNFNHDSGRAAFDTDRRGSSSGVTMNVGQRFLHNAKNGEFQRVLQTAEITRDMDLHGDSATLLEKFRVRTEGRNEAGFLEHRRVQEG